MAENNFAAKQHMTKDVVSRVSVPIQMPSLVLMAGWDSNISDPKPMTTHAAGGAFVGPLVNTKHFDHMAEKPEEHPHIFNESARTSAPPSALEPVQEEEDKVTVPRSMVVGDNGHKNPETSTSPSDPEALDKALEAET